MTLLLTGSAAGEPNPVQKELLRELARPEKQVDLAGALLQVSRDWDPNIQAVDLKPKLEALIQSVRSRLQPGATPQATIDALRTAIHRDGGYGFSDFVDPQGIPTNPAELFLHGLLQSKRGYCMNLSLLYLIVADRLDLPLHGVPLPNHFFVRYDDGQFRANIETTQGGQTFADSFYLDRFLEGGLQGADYYLNNLNKKQTLGAYFNNVGMVMYRGRRTQDALFYLQQSVTLNPRALDAHNNLANIYSDQKQYEQAIEQYQKALAADPNNWQTYFNLGIAYSESGQQQAAFEAFWQAAQINPAYAPVHNVLARMYMEKQLWHGALLHLQSLAELEPRQPGHRLQIAHVYLRMDQPALALESLQETQRLFPLALDVNELMAEAHYRLKQYPAAIAQLEHVIAQAPQTQPAYMQLGWIHYLENRLDRAVEWTQKGLAAGDNPKMAALGQMNLGLYHLVLGQPDEAESWYARALKAPDPMSVQAMTQDLTDAAARYPQKPELVFYLGWVYMKAGKPGPARPPLKRYLKEHPEGPLAERARALLKESDAAPESQAAAPPGMVRVPAGFFLMGSNDHGEDETPQHRVFLSTYFIDETEVSAAEFAEFLNTVRDPKQLKDFHKPDKHTTILNDGKRYFPAPGAKGYPANNVTWYGAKAFCEWKDKRLPTEAEWEKAARGGDGRQYPWGSEAPGPDTARFLQTWTEAVKHRVMAPVRSLPLGKSPYGLYHMTGNVKEWVDDWFDREYYKEENHKVNPEGPIGGEFKVLKGGSWRDLKSFLYASFRNNSYPKIGMDDYGFRCARSAEETPTPGKLTLGRGPVLAAWQHLGE